MSFRTRRFVKENFGSEVRLDNEGELLVVPSAVSEEMREAEADLNKQIDGVLIEQEIDESAEKDGELLQDISESIGDGEVSEEHAETLELVTEHFSRKWGVEHRTLGRESFKYGKDRKQQLESIAGSVIATGVITTIFATIGVTIAAGIDYLIDKLTDKGKIIIKLKNILDGLGNLDNKNESVKEKGFWEKLQTGTDMASNWVTSLTYGDKFIGNTFNDFNRVLKHIQSPDTLASEIEEVISAVNSEGLDALAKLSDKYIGDVDGPGIPILNNKFVNLDVEEVDGAKLIVSAKVTKGGSKPKTADAINKKELNTLLDNTVKMIDAYDGNSKLKGVSKKLGDIKKAAKDKGKDKEDPHAKVKAKVARALGIIILNTRIEAVKHFIDGLSGYAKASMMVMRQVN